MAAALAGVALFGLIVGPPGAEQGATAQGSSLQRRATLLHVATDRPEHPVEAPFRVAQQQWAAAAIEDYRITVHVSQFGPAEEHTVTVEDGEPAGLESRCVLGEEEIDCGEVDAGRFTVAGLFELIREQLLRVNPVPPGMRGGSEVVPGEPILDAAFAGPVGLPVEIRVGHSLIADSGGALTIVDFSLPDPAEDLAFARQRWEANDPDAYSTRVLFWSRTFARTQGVDVRDGAVVAASAECFPEGTDGGEPVPCPVDDPGAATVVGLFALVEELQADAELEVVVRYNVVDGHVERVTWGKPGEAEVDRQFAHVVQFDVLAP
jgi:hypothetical protein